MSVEQFEQSLEIPIKTTFFTSVDQNTLPLWIHLLPEHIRHYAERYIEWASKTSFENLAATFGLNESEYADILQVAEDYIIRGMDGAERARQQRKDAEERANRSKEHMAKMAEARRIKSMQNRSKSKKHDPKSTINSSQKEKTKNDPSSSVSRTALQACLDMPDSDFAHFFSTSIETQEKMKKKYCNNCLAQAACLARALETGYVLAVAGNKTVPELKTLMDEKGISYQT